MTASDQTELQVGDKQGLSREAIIDLLARNDRAVGRALLVLKNNQTADEQQTTDSKYTNNIGFTKSDAGPGTGMALFFERYNRLTPAQLQYWRTPVGKSKTIRIGIYWRQLKKAAEEKLEERLRS